MKRSVQPPGRSSSKPWAFGLALFLLVVLLTGLPYLGMARYAARTGRVYTWLLYNLPDGLSYYAKMRQGLAGSWRFRLPYTADAEPSAYLFLFYLALGHLARVTGFSIPVMFHLARLFGMAALVAALGWWVEGFRELQPRGPLTWAWLALALGMEAWMAFLGAVQPLPEAVPLLSALVNAHFPWTLALMTITLHPSWPERLRERASTLGLLALSGLGLALLAPFAVVVVVTAWVFWALGEAWLPPRRGLHLSLFVPAGTVLVGALPYMVYGWLALRSNPYLLGWHAQNQTPLYPWPAMLLLFAPWWWGLRAGVQQPRTWRLPLAWITAGWVWALAPIGLQRRMLTGMFIPLVTLTVAGWPQHRLKQRSLLFALLVLPTWVLYFLGPVFHPQALQELTLSREEAAALAWLRTLPPGRRVLTGPETGRFIPAVTDHRVFFGHEYETVPANDERAWVTWLLCTADENLARKELARRSVDLILWTPREKTLCPKPAWLARQQRVWQMGQVAIYRVPSQP